MEEEKEEEVKSEEQQEAEVKDVAFKTLTKEEERDNEKVHTEYNAGEIQVLKGLEAVRQRPGMYIGTTSVHGLHHLIREIVDNAVDESLAGYCTAIEVTIEKDGSCTVKDNGRGIPCDIVKETGLSGLETVYTTLHAGGKFEGSTGYKVSGGLHGVGATVVNALSSHVRVTVYRAGKIHVIDLEHGGNTVAPGLRIIGDCPVEQTGTTVNFMPDAEIFKETTTFDITTIREYVRQSAYLNRGLKFSLTDLRDDNNIINETYCYEGGIAEYCTYLDNGKPLALEQVLYFDGETEDHVFAEMAFQLTKTATFNVKSYCNNIRTAGGGTHEDGFR